MELHEVRDALMSEAYIAGRRAGKAGLSPSVNHHPVGSIEYIEWLRGLRSAQTTSLLPGVRGGPRTPGAQINDAYFNDEFDKRVVKTPECWIWIGRLNDAGYGMFGEHRAHRLSLRLVGVEIPDGMMVDHTCRVRHCVNPAHLRVVDARTNTVENSESIAAKNAAKTHCRNGHQYTPENTQITYSKGTAQRDCLICRNERNARRYADTTADQLKPLNRKPCRYFPRITCYCGGRALCLDAA